MSQSWYLFNKSRNKMDDDTPSTNTVQSDNLTAIERFVREVIGNLKDAWLNRNEPVKGLFSFFDLLGEEKINFVNNAKLSAPESMINRYLEHIKEDLENRKQPFNEDELKENYKSQAEWNIKWYLIKDKLLSIEGLNLTDAELDGKISEMILANKENEKQIKSFYRQADNRKHLFDEMLNDKLFEKLTEYASIKVVEQSTNELRKQQANK